MKVKQAADLIKHSSNTIALTGAGISTPSGIPDFRSVDTGLWIDVDPMEVASLSAFRQNPQKFFDWIRPLLCSIFNAKPNPAHFALAELEAAGYLSGVITQNIDNLHRRAGTKTIYEVHGSINTLTCVSCYTVYDSQDFFKACSEKGLVPYCEKCGHILKPDVILYEEQLPYKIWQAAEKAVQAADLMLVIGSSLVITPTAALPVTALNGGAKLIVINNSPTYIDERAEVVINADIGQVLPQIAKEVLGENG